MDSYFQNIFSINFFKSFDKTEKKNLYLRNPRKKSVKLQCAAYVNRKIYVNLAFWSWEPYLVFFEPITDPILNVTGKFGSFPGAWMSRFFCFSDRKRSWSTSYLAVKISFSLHTLYNKSFKIIRIDENVCECLYYLPESFKISKLET